MQIILIILLILAILLVIFTLQNSVVITINLFFWEITDAPLVLVLLICILSGSLLSTIYYLPKLWNLKKERNALRKIEEKRREEILSGRPQKGTSLSDADKLNPEGPELDEDDIEPFFKE